MPAINTRYLYETATKLNRKRGERKMNLDSVHVKTSLENVVSAWGLSGLRQMKYGKWHSRERQKHDCLKWACSWVTPWVHTCWGRWLEIILERQDLSSNWNLKLRQVDYIQMGKLLRFWHGNRWSELPFRKIILVIVFEQPWVGERPQPSQLRKLLPKSKEKKFSSELWQRQWGKIKVCEATLLDSLLDDLKEV